MNSNGCNATRGSGMRAIVAGGAGLIGSHVCAMLLRRGCGVLAIDNFSSGNIRNIAGLFDCGDFRFIQQDIAWPIPLQADWIFNFTGCAPSARSPRRERGANLRACTTGTLNLLREADKCHARMLLATIKTQDNSAKRTASSEPGAGLLDAGKVEVGTGFHAGAEQNRERVRADAEENGAGTRGGASSGKAGLSPGSNWQCACQQDGTLHAETLCLDYHRSHNLGVKIARVHDAYGPHMQLDDSTVIGDFILRALRNEPLTLDPDETRMHSFCYVDDLVEGSLRLMATPSDVTGPIDLANPDTVSIADLAQLIVKLSGSRSRVVRSPAPAPAESSPRCQPDTSAARDTLGWSPHVNLEAGLARTIKWFDSVLSDHRQARAANGSGQRKDYRNRNGNGNGNKNGDESGSGNGNGNGNGMGPLRRSRLPNPGYP